MRRIFATVAVMLAITAGPRAMERVDGIAAVIGDSVILVSELDGYTLLRINAMGVKPDSVNVDSLRKALLQEVIDRKVMLVHAEKDSMITVTEDEVDEGLNRYVSGILRENRLSLEQLEAELQRSQGISLAVFKQQIRKGIREQSLQQKLQQKYTASLRLTRKDVEAFYNQYKDSLPSAGKSLRLSKIEMSVAPADSAKQDVFARISKVKERITAGEDFVAMAKQFSQDPNAQSGGDLGFIAKGTLKELAFEAKAFSLEPGQVSDVFETRLGFHLLKVEEKKEQMVHVRQIFMGITPSAARVTAVRARLDSIRTTCTTQEKFAAAARAMSIDKPTKTRGGDMGWLSAYQMSSTLLAEVDSLPVGAIAGPLEEENNLTLYRVDQRTDNRMLTLQDDWDMLAEKAKEIYAQKKLFELVKKWRVEEFVDIRL